jgi:hypothetical protein
MTKRGSSLKNCMLEGYSLIFYIAKLTIVHKNI